MVLKEIYKEKKMNGQKKSDKEGFYCFKAGDIITRDLQIPKVSSSWYHNEVRVVRVTRDHLWGESKSEEAEQTDEIDGLILLARPGWRYRTGDRVCFCKSGNWGGGYIIMLDPRPKKRLKYLVDLDEDFLSFAKDIVLGEDFWIPVSRRGKTLRNCIFLKEEDIKGGEH